MTPAEAAVLIPAWSFTVIASAFTLIRTIRTARTFATVERTTR